MAVKHVVVKHVVVKHVVVIYVVVYVVQCQSESTRERRRGLRWTIGRTKDWLGRTGWHRRRFCWWWHVVVVVVVDNVAVVDDVVVVVDYVVVDDVVDDHVWYGVTGKKAGVWKTCLFGLERR